MRTQETQRPAARRRCTLAAVTLMAGVGCVEPTSTLTADGWPPVLPDSTELHPELVRELEVRVRAIESAPDDALTAARFGLLCEANALWEEALVAFERATALDPSEPAWPFHAALARLPLDDHSGALTWLRAQVERHPTHAPLAALLAEELTLAGAIEEAELRWRAALKAAPQASEVLAGLGETLLNRAKTMEATGYLRQAVRADPGNKRAHYLLGTALVRLGHDQEAATELASGAGARPQRLLDEWAHKARRLSYRPSDQLEQAETLATSGRVDDALDVLERASELWPGDAQIACARGIALARLGRHAAAVDVLKPIRDGRRELEEAQVEFARALRSIGRVEEAVEAYVEARAWRPHQVVVRFELGRALIELGRLEEARGVFEELARERPDDARPHVDLAELELALGDLDAAASALASARRLGGPTAGSERLAARLEELLAASGSEAGGETP